jgi:deazaflavin-dependent oxidoreductase (nitroreductase family)
MICLVSYSGRPADEAFGASEVRRACRRWVSNVRQRSFRVGVPFLIVTGRAEGIGVRYVEEEMSEDLVTMTEIERTRLDWLEQHRGSYLASGGAEGHIIDLTDIGGLKFTTTLLLETFGRKSGQRRINPLIYGDTGGEVVIIASKGGADIHPAWYVNLKTRPEVSFQIATQAFRATWREPAGAERAEIWAFMEKLYPPYKDYQAATKRLIPIVMLSAGDAVDAFKA